MIGEQACRATGRRWEFWCDSREGKAESACCCFESRRQSAIRAPRCWGKINMVVHYLVRRSGRRLKGDMVQGVTQPPYVELPHEFPPSSFNNGWAALMVSSANHQRAGLAIV
ncbi:hypothetical protein CPLU01_03592 [Colletotrichum plurivorum]|uniref:Uncharacterized protein n=1 Tax=Colletotrichum plurivorum TaxID=2175906 RepID=A0A8H6KRV6_9PEZI|nr:hypothetical protein CPLU01_03592 [Colletotrichum plurivorum]